MIPTTNSASRKTKVPLSATSEASSADRNKRGDVSAPQPTPKAWWQWFLLYPTLLVSVIGAIPTATELIRSMRAGVPFGQSSIALQQDDLWAKNMNCTSAPFDGLINDLNVQVDATICKSGDVLVRYKAPREKQAYRWVPVEKFEQRSAQVFLISSAYAESLSDHDEDTLVCQWSPEPGWVYRKLKLLEKESQIDPIKKKCVLEKIRTYTGEVVSRNQVGCEFPCGQSIR